MTSIKGKINTERIKYQDLRKKLYAFPDLSTVNIGARDTIQVSLKPN